MPLATDRHQGDLLVEENGSEGMETATTGPLSPPRYGPITAAVAWNSWGPLENLLSFNVMRHSDHHIPHATYTRGKCMGDKGRPMSQRDTPRGKVILCMCTSDVACAYWYQMMHVHVRLL